MALATVALMARSSALTDRVRAQLAHNNLKAATPVTNAESEATLERNLPYLMWYYASGDSWATAWEAAMAANAANAAKNPPVEPAYADIGADPGVITDAMISATAAAIGNKW